MVIDCRPDDRIKPRDSRAFEATARACASVGWGYRRVGTPDPVLAGNVRWLSGYRHPRFANPQLAGRLRAVFAVPRPLVSGAELAGPALSVLPVLFHLMWHWSPPSHHRTGGMIGSLSHLIRGAAIDAIITGTEKITQANLDAVQLDHAAEQHRAGATPKTATKKPARRRSGAA